MNIRQARALARRAVTVGFDGPKGRRLAKPPWEPMYFVTLGAGENGVRLGESMFLLRACIEAHGLTECIASLLVGEKPKHWGLREQYPKQYDYIREYTRFVRKWNRKMRAATRRARKSKDTRQ